MASEKQIAWATKIRDEKLAEVREIVAGATQNQDKAAHALELLEERSAEKSANFWIDKRSYRAGDLMVHVLRREENIQNARAVVAGEQDALNFDSKRLSEFLHLIDDKVVTASRQRRESIYKAMCAMLDAESLKEATVKKLDRERYEEHGKHGWSKEWYEQMTVAIEEAKNKPVRDYVKG